MEIIKSKEKEKVNNIKIKRKEKILMEKGKKALDIKKMKKQVKRNNLDSISRNHRGLVNTFSSSNRFKCRR